MEAIEKLRKMNDWFNMQSEYFNYSFSSIKSLEKIYDYAQSNNLEFMDNDYLYAELEKQEIEKVVKFIKKLRK